MLAKLRQLIFGNGESKSAAKSRLHFVLVQDRSGLTNEEMAGFKKDLIDVIKRFFIIDDNGVEVAYQRDSGATTLLINSPVLRRRAGGPQAAETKSKAKPEVAQAVSS